jgi:phosphate transport system permease protein
MLMKTNPKHIEPLIFFTLKFMTLLVLVFLAFIIGYIVKHGISALSLDFIFSDPEKGLTAGGIKPAIIGTILLMAGSTLISVPIGIATAIYLVEYATNPKIVRVIRIGINNLAGVPSVVFGLFGLSLFVILFGFGQSILAGSLTLGVLNLPVIIRSTEEALLTVPMTYREASLAIGATKWQTIYKIVLPNALPGVLTGMMLSLGRAAGETAPIMFTCAAYDTPMPGSIFDPIMALSYHIYILATSTPASTLKDLENVKVMENGTVIVLILLVLSLNIIGIILRIRLKKRV